jgi:hypothetical protein
VLTLLYIDAFSSNPEPKAKAFFTIEAVTQADALLFEARLNEIGEVKQIYFAMKPKPSSAVKRRRRLPARISRRPAHFLIDRNSMVEYF